MCALWASTALYTSVVSYECGLGVLNLWATCSRHCKDRAVQQCIVHVRCVVLFASASLGAEGGVGSSQLLM